jgi:hypothetical protein
MPTKKTTTTTTNAELNLTVGNISELPKVVRAGRTSRYAPLYTRVKTLGKDEMISFPISKYSQVQAFRPTIDELGFAVSVRQVEVNGKKVLMAYVSHKKAEEKS